jgi:hypothetical protein
MNQALGIATRGELVTTTLEFIPDFREIVNFAIEDGSNCMIFVVDWLLAASHIDDRQPSHSKCGIAIIMETGSIRTAMLH